MAHRKDIQFGVNKTKLPRGAPKGTYFSQEAADHAVNFIQALKHSKGEWAGKPFILLPWQRKIIEEVFGWLKPDGFRLYNTVYIEIPKKNGKSELAAAVALYLLFNDNEPGAEIYGAARDRDQARIVFDDAADMVIRSPALMKRCKVIDSIKRIVVPSTRSFYRVLSKEVGAKHGFNVHGVIFDELHTQPNRKLYDVLTKNTGDARRQPLYFLITTAGIDRNSICWNQHEKARQIINGNRVDPTFYAVIYGPPDDEAEKWDWEDENNWRAVNPSIGAIIDIGKVRDAFRVAKENIDEENIFKQLRLNIWVKQSRRWMPMVAWDKCGKTPIDIESLKGRTCYGGLDLASSNDLAALGLVFPRQTGEKEDPETKQVVSEYAYDVLMHFWVPQDTADDLAKHDQTDYTRWIHAGYITATEGNVIDYGFIRRTLRETRGFYNLREMAYDRWGAVQLVQLLEEDGFLVDPEAVKKNKFSSAPVVVPFGQGFASMSAPTKELMTLILQGRIDHGGNPVLRWNADNMVVKIDEAGNLKPDKAKATQKIDGMVALIMALDRAIKHNGEDETSDDPGIVII